MDDREQKYHNICKLHEAASQYRQRVGRGYGKGGYAVVPLWKEHVIDMYSLHIAVLNANRLI